MLERYELEAFLTLAEELHFGRTAERLHVSTARISQTIKRLERRVGTPLFDRTSRRVELTAVGRQLYEQIQPAWARIGAALEQAIDAARGVTGTLRVAFVGAAAGQLLVGVTEIFRARRPDCDVRIREAQIGQILPWLNDGEVDLVLADFPVDDPGIVTGPVLVREARMLAVPSGHPLARRTSVSVEDLARTTLLQPSGTLAPPEDRRPGRMPRYAPAGRPIEPGPPAATFQEALTLVGAGQGVFPVGAQARRYYARPDVAYVPFDDAPPVEWGLMWRADGATPHVHAFSQAAWDLVNSHR
ncbi:LysR family transcriptional regulator [Planomonospora sp. ID67723]|uniref:LysR family transcriptional regulator n=1 Tax=Planomonospora sp. ID67723 TaxID=2738134 RepID=UPI0018C3D418|nr:LysR family transcriptional regulator [Planomonospora sp. ID67723]MBG0832558.1 LysR family transcriptional regulator [Planomonospora sp. ID67723]